MNATVVCRAASAAAHAERTPLIKFLGRRVYPPASQIDHTPTPHPLSPTGTLPTPVRHANFSSYRDHAQQHGPLRNSIRAIGAAGSQLGPVNPLPGVYFDRSELPPQYRYARIDLDEIEAIESGGASVVA